MTGDKGIIEALRAIVGRRYVLTSKRSTRRFRIGYRHGRGDALAVVQPGTLVEQWRVAKVCVAAGKIIVMQAANTGLTGGSTPARGYDRDVVIINAMRISGIRLIDEGRQVICLPGATLHRLEEMLKPIGREPHSVIGSSCIGASVFGGICNNSGGALVRRGPAFTKMALFARIDETGVLHLVNHLGVQLGDDPEVCLERLDGESYDEADISYHSSQCVADHEYEVQVRDIDADSPARFNANPLRLYEASGCAGRLILFAVRLATFPADDKTRVFYIGTNNTEELAGIRSHILKSFKSLPVSGEYLHSDAFNIAETYGKDTFLAIRWFGAERMPLFFTIKRAFEQLAGRLGLFAEGMSDRILQMASRLFPNHLPCRMREFRDLYVHHLMLKMSDDGIGEARRYLSSIFPSGTGAFFECSNDEGERAFLHRFAAAGAAVRYRAVHRREVEDIVALDIALKRNEQRWFETLPPDLAGSIEHELYYGHFFCHVFHQDYILRRGCDPDVFKKALLRRFDERGIEYPAEHNVGHIYKAKLSLTNFYRALDPSNSLNPGIGQTSKRLNWQ